MKNPVVIYSSITGNTKLVAEKIRETLGTENFFDVQNAPKDLSRYDVIFFGLLVETRRTRSEYEKFFAERSRRENYFVSDARHGKKFRTHRDRFRKGGLPARKKL